MNQKCKRVKLLDGTVLFGIVEFNDSLVKIRTARKEHLIAQNQITRISETDIDFEGDKK